MGVRGERGARELSHAGDTLYAFTEVLDTAELGEGVGAIRLRLVVTKNLRPWEDEGFTVMVDDFGWPASTPPQRRARSRLLGRPARLSELVLDNVRAESLRLGSRLT